MYEKYLEFAPQNCLTWIKYAELETTLNEFDRTRALYELGVSQEILDKPELLWKSYIDFEISQDCFDKTRALYERLLERTSHVKVLIGFAKFEESVSNTEGARDVYNRAYKSTREQQRNEECVLVLEDWLRFEKDLKNNDQKKINEVEKKMPRKIKKKRMLNLDDGTDAGWEEYHDYIFPDDEKASSGLKMLELAHKWKAGLLGSHNGSGGDSGSNDNVAGDDDGKDEEDEDEIDLGDL